MKPSTVHPHVHPRANPPRRIRAAAALAVSLAACVALQVAPARAAGAAGDAAGQRVPVSEIKVTGNTLLPADAIDAVLARYKGERSIDELKDAAATLQAMYRQAGYGAVIAYLPEQPLTGGQLVLAVLEGRVAQVTVVGNRQFSVDNVRRALPALQEGQTPRVQRLDAQVQLANDNPARKLALTLEPGAKPGDVDARISVSEESASRISLTLDNTGSSQTGRLRMGLAYQNSALFEQDHQLAVQAQFAPEHPGAVRIFSASYRLPLYSTGLMLGAYGTYSNVDAGSTPTAAGALLFNGKGRVLGASLMRLFDRLGEYEQRFTASVDARDYLNNCAIEGLPNGACGTAGESVSVYPLTLEYLLQRSSERPQALSLAVSHNLGLGGSYGKAANFEAVRPGAKRGYTIARLSGFAALPLDKGWRLSFKLSGQASGEGLVPGEQFGLTGAQAVRGYEEREVTGDSGYAASLEVATPGFFDSSVRLVAFGDAGQVSNNLGTLCNATQTRCTLAAAGLGLRQGYGALQLKLDVAQALRAGRVTDKQSTRVHFLASVSFQ